MPDISGYIQERVKKTALSITPAVTKLFNVSLTSGELPSEWKTAHVSPIPKSGDNSNPSNYHPISLLSILSKLLEKHIVNLLTEHLKSHAPLSGGSLKANLRLEPY